MFCNPFPNLPQVFKIDTLAIVMNGQAQQPQGLLNGPDIHWCGPGMFHNIVQGLFHNQNTFRLISPCTTSFGILSGMDMWHSIPVFSKNSSHNYGCGDHIVSVSLLLDMLKYRVHFLRKALAEKIFFDLRYILARQFFFLAVRCSQRRMVVIPAPQVIVHIRRWSCSVRPVWLQWWQFCFIGGLLFIEPDGLLWRISSAVHSLFYTKGQQEKKIFELPIAPISKIKQGRSEQVGWSALIGTSTPGRWGSKWPERFNRWKDEFINLFFIFQARII